MRPPVMVLRVVSLPPTISSRMFPRNSINGMSLVASPWASIEIKSLVGGWVAFTSHRPLKYIAQAMNSLRMSSWVISSEVSEVVRSDQYCSLRRSSNGKSNKVASIWMVSSTETRSTQSNGSPIGSSSRIFPARSRISTAMLARFSDDTIGAITLRWLSCLGGSMAMNIGIWKSSSCWSKIEMDFSDEKTWWLVSTVMMSLYLVTDQYGP